MNKTKQATVQVGQRYIGWDKTWEVTAVENGRVSAFNVDRPVNTITWPLTRFRELTPAK
jgi:hypothetical protein